jgi:serine phosphatase RsbU (regulator of sigma subunit)
MTRKVKAYELWQQMQPSALRKLALAVFLVFGVLGPLTGLMESELHLLSWRFLAVQTLSAGGMAASIILFPRKRWWMTALIVVGWGFIIVLNSGGIGFIVDDRGLRVEFADVGGRKPEPRPSAGVTLAPEELDAIYTQRGIIGACAIALLATGYGVFISVIGKELRQRTRLETEVNIAREIQQSLLPEPTTSAAWYSVAGAAVPATEVAGDFFDVVPLDGDAVAVAVADVAGHGVGAGILSAMTKSAFRSQLRHDASPVNVLENLNATVYDVSNERMFVTFAYVLADRAAGRFRLATAGHPPALFRPSDGGAIEELRTVGLGLGIQSRSHYVALERSFRPGDALLLYTDGVLEAANARGEQFGDERLREIFAAGGRTAEDRCAIITRELERFAGSKVFPDDVSLVCLQFT